MNPVKNYDPREVSVAVGSHIVSGYADGEFVSVERANDAFTRVSGADGEGARAKSNDRGGIITLTLMQTSVSNRILSGFAAADDLNNGGTFPVLVKDNNSDDKHAAEIAWIRKLSPSSRGKEITTTTWVIETNELISYVGGTDPITG